MPRIVKEEIAMYVGDNEYLCKECGCTSLLGQNLENILFQNDFKGGKADDFVYFCDLCGMKISIEE